MLDFITRTAVARCMAECAPPMPCGDLGGILDAGELWMYGWTNLDWTSRLEWAPGDDVGYRRRVIVAALVVAAPGGGGRVLLLPPASLLVEHAYISRAAPSIVRAVQAVQMWTSLRAYALMLGPACRDTPQ